jgi:predicted nucleic acid-binding protein
MAKPLAIIDTSFLIYSTRLKEVNLLKNLRLFFDYILFPKEVRIEFAPDENIPENRIRNEILGQIEISQGFYRACDTYDLVVLDILKSIPKIDDGEAEAIAQSQSRLVPFVLIDDKNALKKLPEMFSHIKFYNTLTIVSLLDITGFIDNYNECIRGLYGLRKFKSAELRKAYQVALDHISVSISPKQLSRKSSLKKILLNY